MKKDLDLFAQEDKYLPVSVSILKRTDKGLVHTGSASNDVYFSPTVEQIEALLSHCAEDWELWFRTYTAFFDDIELQHRGKNDLFRNLKDFGFAGRTWLQQRSDIEEEELPSTVSVLSQFDLIYP